MLLKVAVVAVCVYEDMNLNCLSCLLCIIQELMAQEKAQASATANEEVDLDELMDVSRICIFHFSSCTNVF